MFVFWIAAALLSVAAVMLVMARAARPERTQDETPETAVYRRHLSELEEQRVRGLLDDEAYAAARGEAGRRLLAAKAEEKPASAKPRDPRRDRTIVLGAAVASMLLTLGVYLAVGSPGMKDQPYQARIAEWMGARDPMALPPAERAAVLKPIAVKRPRDPVVWRLLADAYSDARSRPEAVQAYERVLSLDASHAEDWSSLGVNLVAENDGAVNREAQLAFAEALKRDPRLVAPHVFLGQAAIESGHKDAGLALWREVANELPAGDPHRTALEASIAAVASGIDAHAREVANAAPADQNAMIRGMVEGLAAKLRDHPDDAQGWVRLVRAYGVLGDRKAQADALTRARAEFKSRPSDLATIEAAAR